MFARVGYVKVNVNVEYEVGAVVGGVVVVKVWM